MSSSYTFHNDAEAFVIGLAAIAPLQSSSS
jgi:hypothetical protein